MAKAKAKTVGEKAYHEHMAQKPCIACGDVPVCVHHIRNFGGTNAGMGKRNSHHMVLPLCYECHQGQHGIHHDRNIFEMRYGSEADLLAQVIADVWDDYLKLKKEKYK